MFSDKVKASLVNIDPFLVSLQQSEGPHEQALPTISGNSEGRDSVFKTANDFGLTSY